MKLNKTNSSGGVGFCGLLTIAFIVLKLTGFIDWSWWWILAPLWIPLIIVILVLVSALFSGWKLKREIRKEIQDSCSE